MSICRILCLKVHTQKMDLGIISSRRTSMVFVPSYASSIVLPLQELGRFLLLQPQDVYEIVHPVDVNV